MTMVHDILTPMPGRGRPQRKFLATLFVTILVRRGRVNFRHLSRYGDDSERTMARPCREPFDGPDLHQRVLLTALHPRSARVSAHDASFLPKRGQQPFGRGPFFNGGASRAERGLEISTLAGGEGTRRCALTLAVAPTPPGEAATKAEPEESRVDFSTQQLRAQRQRVPPGVPSHGVEGDYAKKPSRDEGVSLERHALTTLRSAADGLCLDPGPHPQRRGARRNDAGTVHVQVVSRVEDLGTTAEAPPRHL